MPCKYNKSVSFSVLCVSVCVDVGVSLRHFTCFFDEVVCVCMSECLLPGVFAEVVCVCMSECLLFLLRLYVCV